GFLQIDLNTDVVFERGPRVAERRGDVRQRGEVNDSIRPGLGDERANCVRIAQVGGVLDNRAAVEARVFAGRRKDRRVQVDVRHGQQQIDQVAADKSPGAGN